jgi:hypothetical protein
MVLVAPAVGVGGLVIFGVGCLILYGAIVGLLKWRERLGQSRWERFVDHNKGKLSLVGGVMALAIVFSLAGKDGLRPSIWIGLTVLGILVGILSFVIPLIAAATRTNDNHSPPVSSNAPPKREYHYKPPASSKAPPIQEKPYQSPSQSSVSPDTHEDPYRSLLAKARYDQSLVDRLIESERKRMPKGSLDDLCRSIIEKWGQGSV